MVAATAEATAPPARATRTKTARETQTIQRARPAAAEPAQVAGSSIAQVILGRPTDHSMTANVLPARDLEVYFEYGTTPGVYTGQTEPVTIPAGKPSEVTIDGLPANTGVYYRLRQRQPGAAGFEAGQEAAFYTQRAPGSTFAFDIQADSHPERTNKQFDPDLYPRSLANVAGDRPDFYISLGDDFSVDTLKTVNQDTVTALYEKQRQWLEATGAPIFLVNGNHEQASQANLDGTADNVAVWAQTARNAYFPQPAPDGFYTGDGEPVEHIGLLRDHYAFTWGDALFVAIDPYWHSPVAVDNAFRADRTSKGKRDLWSVTLGEEQYQWFKETLEKSTARYKFVFAHHVNGTGRGGIELAGSYEWGDAAGLPAHRPGWDKTIHQLMADNGVSVFFQGHDHIFVRQELDGVIYQTLPEPANPFYSWENADAYKSGDKLPNSGHLRVTVSPQKATVDYIRAFLPADEKDGHYNGEVAFSYTIAPKAGLDAASAAPAPPAAATSSTAPAPIRAAAAFAGDIVLGGPTGTSVTASLLPQEDMDAYLEYGTAPGVYAGNTDVTNLAAGKPSEILLEDLEPDTAYFYRVRYRAPGQAVFAEDAERTFRTQRAEGSTFTFTVDADPHNRDPNFNPEVYGATLRSVLAGKPDFHIDLGDTFMAEKIAPASYEQVVATYREMRPFFGQLDGSAPLFLVNGNHDGEWGSRRDGRANDLAAWATGARRAFYPNPTPGGFYSGSTVSEPLAGVRDSYHAWTWGDALFVVLDPFWYSTRSPQGSATGWDFTLGDVQYQWLKRALEASSARYKFVFSHNLVGGQDQNMRGGIEAAGLYEWGGKNADGSWGFAAQRPGWPAPIHQLLVDNHVTIFFHGHDHLFVKQDLDGVVYQEVPQPSYASYDKIGSATSYGYTHGDVQGCCGYLRVTVSPAAVKVDYVRSYCPQDENAQRHSGEVSYSYAVPAP